jgi:hypothetical protein
MKSLDEIMSREGEPMPEREEPAIETPVVAAEEPAPVAVEPGPPEAEPHEADQSGMVPVGALHAERAKGRKYTEELAATNRRLDELQALLTQARQQQQPPPAQPQQPPPAAPDFWEDPDKALEHRTSQMLDPVREALMFNARLTAEAIHKSETVKEAEAAFNAMAAAGQLDPEIHRRINTSPNPFHAAVQWHQHVKRQEALNKYGDDPEAAFEAEVQRRIAALQGGAGVQPSQPSPQTPQAMPSSFAAARSAGPRAAPQWSGPKPLSEIMNGR